ACTHPFVHVTHRLRNHTRLLTRRLGLFPDLCLVHRRVRTLVPGDLQRREALFRGPVVIANHSDQVLEDDHLAHTWDRFGCSVVDLVDGTAEHRTGCGRCDLDAFGHHVDAVD